MPVNTVNISASITKLIEREQLPSAFSEIVEIYYQPLTEHLAAFHGDRGRPVVIGINGSQGSGKSTLAMFLKLLLEERCGLRSVVISIDDLYLTKTERLSLAGEIHPLLATRGVPGTHDVSMGVDLINRLVNAQENEITCIPKFDKATDDRCAMADWNRFAGKADVVILEGWCVGAHPQPAGALNLAVNTLEQHEDRDGIWRHYVNDQLINKYPALFSLVDYLIMLRIPGFDYVQSFRMLQEQKLSKTQGDKFRMENDAALADKKTLGRFIMHYERLTRNMLREMPQYADVILEIDPHHHVCGMIYRGRASGI